MTYSFQNPSQEVIFDYLKEAKTIAVVGLSSREETAAYRVSKLMQEAGYQIIPVNPRAVGETILGEKVYASLLDIDQAIDIVDVFRRSEFLADVAREFVQTEAKVFWAQLGLESQEAEELLRQAGRNDIVMNKCIKIEYLDMLKVSNSTL
ncbi:CoA-binding protein [Streptococcus suis]|nr:CoA-binding protein [Streptococcus suis]